MSRLTDLAELAAEAELPALDERTSRRLVDSAIERAAWVSPPVRPRMRWLPALALASAAAVFGWWLRPVPSSAPQLLQMSLPTGDALVGIDAPRFEVTRLDPTDRQVALHEGTLLADVARVAPAQHFAITTPHLTAIAKGTVFSVETAGRRSRVRVYEGIVEVIQARDHYLVNSGDIWTSDTHTLVRGGSSPPMALVTEIARRVAAREKIAVAPAAPTPPVAPTSSSPSPSTPNEPSPVASATTPNAQHLSPGASTITSNAQHVAPTSPIASSPSSSNTAPGPSSDEMLAASRAALAAGKLEEALAIAERASRRGFESGEWHVLTADVLRGLGRAESAATMYQRAALELAGPAAYEAGYSAAYLRFKELEDPDGALLALQTTRVDSADSPLEERGLALHVRILQALGRETDVAPIAHRYLERYPHGELALELRTFGR